MVGILVSFWDGLFSGAMLVSGSEYIVMSKIRLGVGKSCRFSVMGSIMDVKGQEHEFKLIML